MCHTMFSTISGQVKMFFFFKLQSLKIRQALRRIIFSRFQFRVNVRPAERAVSLKVGFVLLDLDHEVVQVDELGADGQAAERGLIQDLVKAVVVLDELSQGALQDKRVAI